MVLTDNFIYLTFLLFKIKTLKIISSFQIPSRALIKIPNPKVTMK